MKNSRATYGTGTVYKQGDSYVTQLLYTVEIDGKSYSKRISGSGKTSAAAVRKRNKNAQRWEEKLRDQLKQEKLLREVPERKRVPTLNELFEANISMKEAGIQIPTSDNYKVYYEGYVQDAPLGKMPVNEITEEYLLDFYKDLRINGRKRFRKDKQGNPIDKKPLSINTVNHVRFVLFNTFLYAEKKGYIEHNPHSNIAPFKAGTAAMLDFSQEDMVEDEDEDTNALNHVIPIEDVNKILSYAMKHSRLAGLFAWAVNSGMRQGECLGLKVENANPEKGYVVVKRSLTYVRDKSGEKNKYIPKLKKPKNNKERTIPFNTILEEIYQYQIALIAREKEEAGVFYSDKGLLFADEYGNYLRPWSVIKEFQRILEAVGVEKHRFHDLRHTFVSLLVRESQKSGDGISVLEVCKIVGHADATITLRIYGGLFPSSTEKAMKTLDRCKEIYLPRDNRWAS